MPLSRPDASRLQTRIIGRTIEMWDVPGARPRKHSTRRSNMDSQNHGAEARSTLATGSALVRVAKKLRRIANAQNLANAEYGALLEARYGWNGEELDDDLVEVVDYANDMNQRITLAWIDARMARIGLKPNGRDEPRGPTT